MKIEKLISLSTSTLDELTALWERSVRSSHHFLTDDDIAFYKPLVHDHYLKAVSLYVIRNTQGNIAAFMGLSDDMIEMLFVDPNEQGKGYGKVLVNFAVKDCHIYLVDVNEDNHQAYQFYKHMGYEIISRDATDPTGKPFPILHLKKHERTMIDEILENNRRFVERKGYEKHITDGNPSGRTLIVTCMDTRLSVMLPEALGIKNGEVKMVKVAGGVILDDYDAVMRSIVVGIYELGIQEIMLIHHTDCGAGKMHGRHMEELIRQRIPQEQVDEVEKHINLNQWLDGFGDTERSVRSTMDRVKNHPLVPK